MEAAILARAGNRREATSGRKNLNLTDFFRKALDSCLITVFASGMMCARERLGA